MSGQDGRLTGSGRDALVASVAGLVAGSAGAASPRQRKQRKPGNLLDFGRLGGVITADGPGDDPPAAASVDGRRVGQATLFQVDPGRPVQIEVLCSALRPLARARMTPPERPAHSITVRATTPCVPNRRVVMDAVRYERTSRPLPSAQEPEIGAYRSSCSRPVSPQASTWSGPSGPRKKLERLQRSDRRYRETVGHLQLIGRRSSKAVRRTSLPGSPSVRIVSVWTAPSSGRGITSVPPDCAPSPRWLSGTTPT